MYQQGRGRNPSNIQSCAGAERVWSASREAGAELPSPVDLWPEAACPLRPPPSAPLRWAGYHATPTALTLTNSGFTVMVNACFGGGETPGLSRGPLAAEYVFSQIHFHWGEHDRTGSGHSVNGVRYPLEMHVVHLKKECVNLKEALQSKDGLVVLVYLFHVGEERNSQLERVSGALQWVREARACARLPPAPLAELVPPFCRDYLLYWGTVGSPSGRCRILWMVSRRFLPVSARQLREFRQLYDLQGNSILSNSSKPHPLGSRTIFLVSASNETSETGNGVACGTSGWQEDLSDDTSVDIRDAEYKSLCDLEEVINKNCRICPIKKRLQNVTHVNVEYPYQVHEGDTSVEESCVDLSNGTDCERRGVTVKTETEADPSSRRVTNVTNVNVTTCRSHRDRGREEVYMVVSARGSELHLRRTGTVRRHQPSLEQACLMLGPTRSSSAPSLNMGPTRTEQMSGERDDQFFDKRLDNTDYNRYYLEDRRESENTDKRSHYLLVKEVTNKKKCYKVIGELPKYCDRNDSVARNIPKITEKVKLGNDRTLTTEESGAVLKNQVKKEYSEFQQYQLYDEREHRKATHKRVIPHTVPTKPLELVNDEKEKNNPSDNNGAGKCPLNRTSEINMTTESDPRYKVSLLVRTTVSDHRGSSQKYYVTKISPKDGPIFVTPKSSNSNVEKCSGNEGQYYIANPIFERGPTTKPGLDVPNESSDYTINEANNTEYEETKEEYHKQFKKEQYLKTSDKEVIKEDKKCKPYHPIRSNSNNNKQLQHESLDNADIVIDSGKADPQGQVSQQYSSSKVNETKKHSKLAERINYYYGKNPPDEDVEMVDKVITGNVGKNDSTEVFVRGKQVKIVNPRKSDVSKEVNYNLVTSRHPEPQNHSQPRATVRQHLSLDQQIQGQSQVRQTVEYHDKYKPPKGSELPDRNMTAATYELASHQAYKSTRNSQSNNYNNNGSTHSEIGEADPESNLPEQCSQRYEDVIQRTDPIQEDDKQIEQRFQDSIDESVSVVNEYKETSSSKRFENATVKKRVEYEGDPMPNRARQPVENNQNKPNDNLPAKQTERPRVSFKNENQTIYGGVEYEETAEEDSVYTSRRIRIKENKLTSQNKDIISYENKIPDKTKPSNEPLIVKKIEIPEPHYITRVPKQALVEFEAYTVDPYEPFQIISESHEISSTMRAHKTFMMFKKINGKAVLNQPSVIEPITMKANRNKPQLTNDKSDIENVQFGNNQMSEQNRLPLSRSQTLPNLLANAGKVFIEEYDEENITHDKQNQLVMRKQTRGAHPSGVENKTQSKTKIQQEYDNYQPIVNGEIEAKNNKLTTGQKEPQAIILRNSDTPGERRVLEEFEYSETSLLSQQKIIRKQKRYTYNAQQPTLLEEPNPSIESGYSNARSIQTTGPVAAQEEQLLATPPGNLDEGNPNTSIDRQFYESKINENKTYKTSKRFESNQREMNPPWGNKDRSKFVQDISPQNRNNQETDTDTDSNEASPSDAEGNKPSPDLGVVLVRDSPSQNINIIKSDSTFQNGNNANLIIDKEYYENTTNNKSYKSSKRLFESHQRGGNRVPIRPTPLRSQDNIDNDYNYEIDDRPNNKSSSYEQPSDPRTENVRDENILDISQGLTHPSDCSRVEQDAPSQNRNIESTSTNKNTSIYIDQQYYESSTNKSKSYKSTNRAGLSPQLTDRPGPMPLPPQAQNPHIFLKPYDRDEPTKDTTVLSSGAVQNETRDDRVSELPESNHKSQSYKGQGNTSDPMLVRTTVPSTKKEGDIVIFIRQPYVQKEQVVPKITVDVTDKHRVSPSQMNQQTVQIQELKPKRKNTGKRRTPAIKSKIEHVFHQSNTSDSSSDENMESSLLTESNEERVVDTTHYNFTLKSQTKVDISKSEKANVRSTAEVRITPALNNSEPTIRLAESCSDVKMTETTSYETSSADACDGQQAYQSPIQIESRAAETRQFPRLIFHNHWNTNGKVLLENNGKTLRASLEGEGEGPSLEGGPLVGRYHFVELHFHWGGKDCCGAEHVIDGQRHALEAHFLYVKKEYESLETGMQHADGLATVAVKFDVGGPPNEGLGRLIADIRLIREASTGVHVPASALFGWLRPTVRSAAGYFCYKGALTKDPPCVDSVTWLVFPQPIPFCCQQSSEFRKLKSLTGEELRKNFRTPKPLNNRPVYYVPQA